MNVLLKCGECGRLLTVQKEYCSGECRFYRVPGDDGLSLPQLAPDNARRLLFEALGQWSMEICRPDAELAPPQYLLDAIDAALGERSTPSIKDSP